MTSSFSTLGAPSSSASASVPAVRQASRIMMIKPRYFNVNKEAAKTNIFMRRRILDDVDIIVEMAMQQHDGLHQALIQKKVPVILYDNENTDAPDAVFCNNWITVHHEDEAADRQKHIIVYPMALQNRRIEVRNDIISNLAHGYADPELVRIHDMRLGTEGSALEGTGSMVLDRRNRIVYAALSPRTHLMKLLAFGALMNYEIVYFNTFVEQHPIYHTNVMLSIGEEWIVVCSSVIHESQRERVMEKLAASGRKIIDISVQQMMAFCGNILQVTNADGLPLTVMSDRALGAFTYEQLDQLGDVISVPFDILESYGGGGVRCCMTEV